MAAAYFDYTNRLVAFLFLNIYQSNDEHIDSIFSPSFYKKDFWVEKCVDP